MVKNIKVATSMIKNKAMVSFTGQMVTNMKDSGTMVSSMVRDILPRMAIEFFINGIMEDAYRKSLQKQMLLELLKGIPKPEKHFI